MGRKDLLKSLLLLAVVFFAAYISLVPQWRTQEVVVSFPILRVQEHLLDPTMVARWYLPFAEDAANTQVDTTNERINNKDFYLQVQPSSVLGANYITGKTDREKKLQFVLVPGDTGSVRVQLVYKNTLFNHWVGTSVLLLNARKSLTRFKNHMEDTKSVYGYEINFETVVDTAFLFRSRVVQVENMQAEMGKLFDELVAYAEKKDAGFNGTRIFYKQPVSSNRIELFAGIAVTNRINPGKNEVYKYKLMPGGKNLLVAFYQGPYGEIYKAYDALQNFKSDHNLISMAIPFEKFLGADYSFADSQLVQLKVYYPIF